jgi:hypothetical protein
MPLPDEIVSQLPEDVRSDPALSSFNDLGSLAKSYVETKSLVGSSIRLPGKDSKPEDIDKWSGETSAKLKDHGLTLAKLKEAPPATPDAYEFKLEGVTPEQIKGDKVIQSFSQWAHKNGVGNAQANGMVEWYAKEIVPMLQEQLRGQAPEILEEQGAIERVLGNVFKADTKQMLGARDAAINQLKAEIPELEDFLNGTAPYGKPWMTNKDHPALVKLLKFVADAKQPDFGGNLDGIIGGETLDSIQQKIDAIRENPKMSGDKKAEAMLPLYKIKDALIKRTERGQ